MKTFGGLVRDRRLFMRLSQQRIADRSGISRNYISMMERDMVTNPSLGVLSQLATALALDRKTVLSWWYEPREADFEI